MISVKSSGDYGKISAWLGKIMNYKVYATLEKYAQRGIELLSAATPIDSGATAGSWTYEVAADLRGGKIIFSNTNVNEGVNIAIILQTGHGTGTGGWVEGIDYINPAMQETFQGLADEVWAEVTSLK